ncbi:MAG: serine/threonine-protein kinase, partial [Vicinamibacterales bacterium]
MVAIKILSADIALSADARQRFEREARTISQLSHPHICALYDVGETAPSAPGALPLQFLVMELVEGETLAQRLRSRPLPLDLTLRYAIEIADALDKAHRAGIVHRDLKPANVMITRTGVKLLDFGLAKVSQSIALVDGRGFADTVAVPGAITEAGSFLGTLQYMSPEQLEGGAADTRSDLFALGTVLYEMATGRKAFDGANRITLASAVLRQHPPPPSSVNPAIPPALDVLIHACLAKDPDNRWQHARDVTIQLTSIEAASTADPTLSGVAPDLRKRRGAAAWVSWLVAAAALTAAMSLGLRLRTRPAVGAVSFPVSPPPGTRFVDTVETVPFALSPDGASLVMVAYEPNGSSHLW